MPSAFWGTVLGGQWEERERRQRGLPSRCMKKKDQASRGMQCPNKKISPLRTRSPWVLGLERKKPVFGFLVSVSLGYSLPQPVTVQKKTGARCLTASCLSPKPGSANRRRLVHSLFSLERGKLWRVRADYEGENEGQRKPCQRHTFISCTHTAMKELKRPPPFQVRPQGAFKILPCNEKTVFPPMNLRYLTASPQ